MGIVISLPEGNEGTIFAFQGPFVLEVPNLRSATASQRQNATPLQRRRYAQCELSSLIVPHLRDSLGATIERPGQ